MGKPPIFKLEESSEIFYPYGGSALTGLLIDKTCPQKRLNRISTPSGYKTHMFLILILSKLIWVFSSMVKMTLMP